MDFLETPTGAFLCLPLLRNCWAFLFDMLDFNLHSEVPEAPLVPSNCTKYPMRGRHHNKIRKINLTTKGLTGQGEFS